MGFRETLEQLYRMHKKDHECTFDTCPGEYPNFRSYLKSTGFPVEFPADENSGQISGQDSNTPNFRSESPSDIPSAGSAPEVADINDRRTQTILESSRAGGGSRTPHNTWQVEAMEYFAKRIDSLEARVLELSRSHGLMSVTVHKWMNDTAKSLERIEDALGERSEPKVEETINVNPKMNRQGPYETLTMPCADDMPHRA